MNELCEYQNAQCNDKNYQIIICELSMHKHTFLYHKYLHVLGVCVVRLHPPRTNQLRENTDIMKYKLGH